MSNQVKHLTLYVDNIDELKFIIARFENFSSITFRSHLKRYLEFDDAIEEIEKQGRDFLFHRGTSHQSIWFGRLKK
jgi:hypothetical protein